MLNRLTFALLLTALITLNSYAQTEPSLYRKPRVPNHEYANVVMNNYSEANNIAPVVFNHWLHRAKYTCKVCHVDIGYAMKAGGSDVSEHFDVDGPSCSICHNGEDAFDSLRGGPDTCEFCHSYEKKVAFKNSFYKYTKGFPRGKFGNGIDWMKAEKTGIIKLQHKVDGITEKIQKMSRYGEIELRPKNRNMPRVIFSHDKHAIWNGCDSCHPLIYETLEGPVTFFSMNDIFAGKYCGVCHGKVSFPPLQCQRCHSDFIP